MTAAAIREMEREYAEGIRENMKNWAFKRNKQRDEMLERKGLELRQENVEGILKATSFTHLSRNKEAGEQCVLYSKGKSCHPNLGSLNCYLCACPHYNNGFLEDRDEKILVGRCKVLGEGEYHFSAHFPSVGVWDCSQCLRTHSEGYVRRWIQAQADMKAASSEK